MYPRGVGFAIDRRARSRKGRGLFRKSPDPREIGERLGRLARRMAKAAVTRAGWKQDRYLVDLALHPAGPPATLTVLPDAELSLRVDAATVGPAYVAFAVERVAPILDELDYAWTEPFDLAAVQAGLCAWVAGELAAEGQVRIGVPSTRRFRIDAPVLTALGPRDAAWRDAVLADPARARDAFAWWELGPGHLERSRALLAMWLEVPWREPLDKDERDLMTRVDEGLRAARDADGTLELPWPDWKELLFHIGIEDEDVNEHAGDRAATIGYRRHELEVELSGGWRAVLPGAMVGHWEDDGARYWATDGDRAVEFTSLTAGDETDSGKLLAVAPERYPVVDSFADGARHGRAEAYEENEVPIVIGLVTQAPHVGILTCKGGTREWALATWKSLRQRED